jgi:hypothetical protein
MTHRFDRGAEHTFICNGDVRWHIDSIINGIYFNCSRMLPDGRFQECTIICPPHKQAELACEDGLSNGGPWTGDETSSSPVQDQPPYSLEHHKTKRAG